MKIINAFFMSLSTFCALPCPVKKWDEEAKPLMILTLPFVGLWIGFLWYVLTEVLYWLQFPFMLSAALCTAFIYLITGYIHIDGYMDVADAVGSYKSIEERRKILKDAHCGSFAIISAVLLIGIMFAAFASSLAYENRMLIFIPFVSRAMSGIMVNKLKPMPGSQYAQDSYRKNIKGSYTIILVVMIILAVIVSYLCLRIWAEILIAEIIAHALATLYAYRNLDGMNGDISGFAICIAELIAVITMVLI